MKTGTHKGTQFDERLDCDGELEIQVESLGGSDWLTKPMALDVIKHIVKAFGMDEILEAVELFEETTVN